MKDVPRILVLGSTGHPPDVEQFDWSSIPAGLNVVDFEIVIVNLSSLETARQDRSNSPRPDRAEIGVPVEDLPSRRSFARQMSADRAELVFVGRPLSLYGTGFGGPQAVRDWLPAVPEFCFEDGSTIAVKDERFGPYLETVESTQFCMRNSRETLSVGEPPKDVLALELGGDHIYYYCTPIAVNRADEMVAAAVHWSLGTFELHDARRGHYVWLPGPTTISPVDGINLLLKSVFGVGRLPPPPEWAPDFQTPAAQRITSEVAELEGRIHEIDEELGRRRESLQTAREMTGLLYLQGDDLEVVVRQALRDLGATVDPPVEVRRKREDGRLRDPSGRPAVLEIKGRTGDLKLSDVNQLLQWRDEADGLGKSHKGILVCNLQCETHPGERKRVFPDNAKSRAQALGLCLITTGQIFAALVALQNGTFDSPAFWDAIFAAAGPVPLPDLHGDVAG